MYVSTIFIFLAVISGYINAEYEKELNDKVAVVTGGAKGIGYAIAESYLKHGVRKVIIVDKDLPRGLLAEKTLTSLYGANRTLFVHGNVITDLDRVSNIIFRTCGYVDILVNNAGILDEYNPEKTILTNLRAPVLWSKQYFNLMRKDAGGKGGTIMNVASVSGYSRDPFVWNYKASKFGLLGLSFSMGHEFNFLTSGVRVFAICPGYTYTDLTRRPGILYEQVEVHNKFIEGIPRQQPEVVGDAAALLYKTATSGTAYTIEGGELSVSPDSINITAEYLLSL